MDTLEHAYTCAACRKRKKKVYSYYGTGNGEKLCSKACRDAYINYKRELANERARKRIAQAPASTSKRQAPACTSKRQAPASTSKRQAPASTSKKSGFRFLGIQIW